MYRNGLDGWERAAREGKLSQAGKALWLPSELELELAHARKELAKAKMGGTCQKICNVFREKRSGGRMP